jgi:elongation factor 1 alpha-like protein
MEVPSPELRGTPLSIRDRLAANNAKSPKPAEGNGALHRLSKPGLSTSSLARKPTPDKSQPAAPSMPPPVQGTEVPVEEEPEDQEPKIDIRASPSTFASTIVGTTTIPTPEPGHLHSNSVDLLRIYGQNHAEPFDFAGPSPDDVVLNAQNTAKGLAFRSKVGTAA